MFVVIVNALVKPEFIDDFIEATTDNAVNSNKEPGIARFDFYQQQENPARFTLVEIYHSEEDPDKHRSTEHYNRWKNGVEKMMVEPRTRTVYKIIYPQNIEG